MTTDEMTILETFFIVLFFVELKKLVLQEIDSYLAALNFCLYQPSKEKIMLSVLLFDSVVSKKN